MNRTIDAKLTPEEWEWIQAMRNAKRCAEKTPHDSKTLADKTARHEMRKPKNAGKMLKPYLCPVCNKWHLTSKG